MTQWYYAQDSERQGPLAENDLVKKLISGELPKSILVWKEGLEEWLPAMQSDLATLLSPPPPTAPPNPGAPIPVAPSAPVTGVAANSTPAPAPTPSPAVAPENPYQAPQAVNTPIDEDNDLHTTELIYASRLVRLGAAIIDNIILTVLLTIFLIFTGAFEIVTIESPGGFEEFDDGEFFAQEPETTYAIFEDTGLFARIKYGIYFIFTYFCVNGYLLAKRGQTVGKFICGIQIVNYNTGRIPDMVALGFTRFFCTYIASSVIFLFWVIDVLLIFTDERRCLHDRMANTKVVLKGKSTRDY